MRIKLDDEFMLNGDRYCVWISKKSVRKKGKNAGTEDVNTGAYCGYHKNIENCFESFFDKEINASESTSITKLLDTIKRERQRIKGWCEALDKDIKLIKRDGGEIL